MSAGILVAGLLLLYVVASGKAAAMWAALTGQAPPGTGSSPAPAAGSDTGDGATPTGAALASLLGSFGRAGSSPVPTGSPSGATGANSSPYLGLGGYSGAGAGYGGAAATGPPVQASGMGNYYLTPTGSLGYTGDWTGAGMGPVQHGGTQGLY